jgi:hypothetical protein
VTAVGRWPGRSGLSAARAASLRARERSYPRGAGAGAAGRGWRWAGFRRLRLLRAIAPAR